METKNAVKSTKIVDVLYPKNARFGEQVRLTAVLPLRSRDLPIEGFDNFQREHNGKVTVVNVAEGISTACIKRVGEKGVEAVAEAYGESITKHFGFPTAPLESAKIMS